MLGRHWRRLVVALAGGGCIAQAAALDLAQAWQAAVAVDPQLRAARASAAGSRERIPQARSSLLPQVNASAQRARNELRSEAPGFLPNSVDSQHSFYTSRNQTLSVRQALFRPQLTAQLRQAEALVAGAEAALEEEEQKLAIRVAQEYFDVLLADEQLRLVRVQQGTLRGQLEAARKGMAAGSGTRTDIDEAQARLDLNTALEVEAAEALEYARRQLVLRIGQPLGPLATVATASLQLLPPEPNRLEDWLARAEAASPELRAASAQVVAAREEVERARAAHYPTLDAYAQDARSDSENPTRVDSRYRQKQVGLQLNVPLYQGGLLQSQVRQALAEVDRTEGVLEATRLDLSSRVHREFRGMLEGVARVRALEQAVRSSEQLVVSSRRSQQAGSRTVLDILNAEQQLGTAQRDLAQARFNYLLARMRLRTLAGDPRDAVIADVNRWLAP